MTLAECVLASADELERAGIRPDIARLDAELLARHVLGWDRATYFSSLAAHPPVGFDGKYAAAVARRTRREPVSLITGRRMFWDLEFDVTRDVLCPRAETELIVEEAIALAAAHGAPRTLLDAGTGSGCLAVTLARIFAGARILATDISAEAIRIARRNAARHGVERRIQWIQTDYFAGIGGSMDLIVSNPPYIPDAFLPGLSPEVRDHEPAIAFAGGDDGLAGIRTLAAQAVRALAPDGWLIFEFGYGQEDDVRTVIGRHPELHLDRVRGDLQGIARTAVVRRLEP